MFYTISNNAVNDFFQDLDSVFKPSSNFSNGKSYKTETTDDGITLTMETPGYNKNLIDVMVEVIDLYSPQHQTTHHLTSL